MSEQICEAVSSDVRTKEKRRLSELIGLAAFGISSRLRRWYWDALRSRIYGLALRANGMKVGSNFRCIGRHYIQIGEKFHSLDRLWLEAVFDGQGRAPILRIGANVTCSDAVHIAARNRVIIGSGVLIGSHVLITDHNHGSYHGNEQSDPMIPPALRAISRDGEVTIGDNVWIGDQVVVLPGSQIGSGSVIGSQTVVRGSIPENCIAVGNPMRLVRIYDRNAGVWRAVGHD